MKTVDTKLRADRIENCSGRSPNVNQPAELLRRTKNEGRISRCSLKKMEAQDMEILRFL
jgi:hypothetical protein